LKDRGSHLQVAGTIHEHRQQVDAAPGQQQTCVNTIEYSITTMESGGTVKVIMALADMYVRHH